MGWPEYYSDDPEEDKSLFLCNASWLDEEGKPTKLERKGILITQNQRIDSIEFLN